MERIAKFIVARRHVIFLVFMGLAVLGTFCAAQVKVNMDMTKYLPATMEMKQGQDIMTQQFGEASVVELMVKGPQTSQEREDFGDDLADFDSIVSVSYDADSSRFNNGEYVRYQITAGGGTYSDEVKSAVAVAEKACESRGYECWVDAEYLGSSINSRFALLMVFAVCIAMVILWVLAASWIEPLLILFVILIAVLINLGSNLVLGEVSETTNAIGAILQMVLSMDYIIMLLNRYRAEQARGLAPLKAMEQAIARGVGAIASSSITTVAGLLCLVLMSFTIGRDLGVVLAKGVFLSLLCAFAVMPALILWFNSYMEATAKPAPAPKMKALAGFSHKFRYGMLAVFAALLIVGFGCKGMSQASFLIPSQNDALPTIEEQFSEESQVVVVYKEADQGKSGQVTKELASMDGVVDASSYASTLGKQYRAEGMADEADMDAALLRVLYYQRFKGSNGLTMTGQQLEDYVRKGLAAQMGASLDKDTKSNLGSLADLVKSELKSQKTYTVAQAAQALKDYMSISSGLVKFIYLAHTSGTNAYDESWTMSTDELMSFLVQDVLQDPAYDKLIDDADRTKITDAAEAVDEARGRLVNEEYGRIILQVGFAPSSTEMDALCTQLRQKLDGELGEYWLVGEGPMVQEMAAAFTDEFNFISIITVLAIFLIVLVTFRNLLIPLVLVALIQTAFNLDLLLNAFVGSSIYYVALLVVQSILMGATIDYAILYTTSYREARESLDVRESVGAAYRASIRTVAMSGSVLVLVCFVLGFSAGGITGQICLVISEGALASVLLVLLVLPGSLAALDRLVVNRKKPAAQD